VAVELGAEVIGADAFQIYEGFDVLSGKPGLDLMRKVPHHLVGTVALSEQMNAARFRDLALPVIDQINRRGKVPVVVGGSGLYIKSLTDGLADLPAADPELRGQLKEVTTEELSTQLRSLDPQAAARVDTKNRRRLIRAIEIAVLGQRPVPEQRTQSANHKILGTSAGSRCHEGGDGHQSGISGPRMISPGSASGRCHKSAHGVFVFRDRDQLYERINQRVEGMLRNGAIDEVKNGRGLSATAEQMIGVGDIRKHLSGQISLAECIAAIQQATRRYAKRQLTWFRHQTTFEPLNLSLLNYNEAVKWVVRQALAAAHGE
ncbi:MAG: tRNA (adenosine(37)-N6)-dimethylallyltransferase, partial [Chthoniobacterales bacterium]